MCSIKVPTFKVIITGDGGVGKTAFINRHITGEFNNKYEPTIGVDIRSLQFSTTCGQIIFNCWDTAGQDKLAGLRDGYYIGGDAAIIMFDVSSRITYRNVPTWHKDLVRVIPSIPIILVGSKVDRNNNSIRPKDIFFHHLKGLKYYNISTKNCLDIEKPFLYITRKLTKNNNCNFVNTFAPLPPTDIVFSNEEIEKNRKMFDIACRTNLPYDDMY